MAGNLVSDVAVESLAELLRQSRSRLTDRRSDQQAYPRWLVEVYEAGTPKGDPVSLVADCVFPGRGFRRDMAKDVCDASPWEYFTDVWLKPLNDVTTIPNQTRLISVPVESDATIGGDTRHLFVSDYLTPGEGNGDETSVCDALKGFPDAGPDKLVCLTLKTGQTWDPANPDPDLLDCGFCDPGAASEVCAGLKAFPVASGTDVIDFLIGITDAGECVKVSTQNC